MLQSFIIVLREGFEGFLIVAITLAYLIRTQQKFLVPAVYLGLIASLAVSAGLGFWLWQGASGPLWEGIFGLISAVFIGWLVWHMWVTAPRLKKDMEVRLTTATQNKSVLAAQLGVFIFTILMISREGMETALLLIQVHEPQIILGVSLGAICAAGMCFLWTRFSHLIDLKRFFQVTSIFLFLFIIQILIYSFHEFTEAGIFPNSEALHVATEPFSPEGLYGKWFTLIMIAICGVWLLISRWRARASKKTESVGN